MDRIISKEELAQATKLAPPFSSPCLLADGKTVVKGGEGVREAEANAMKLVRQHTSIPVPEVYNVYRDADSGHMCIVMEYIDGEQLDKAWPRLSEEQKNKIIQQLREYFVELRQIKGSFIGGVDGSACDDQYFSSTGEDWGPYKDEAEFNKALVKAWSTNRENDPFTRLLCKIQVEVMSGHEIVMTHNDFDPRNILVRGSDVVAVLDWEFSGFFPEYWEYCNFILLHGLGSNGEKFGKELLETGIDSNGQSLASRFPGAKFIFPTSRRRRSTAFRRAMLTQWFDVASLDDPSDRNHKQIPGLRESFQEIKELIELECSSGNIPQRNIILGGLSQGCAMALICLLALDFPIGGFVGMSGWLPFQQEIEKLARGTEGGENDISDNQSTVETITTGTHADTQEELRSPEVHVPDYIDEKIKISLGEDASQTMSLVGYSVDWRRYKDQGHWYKIPDEIDDITEFIHQVWVE
ncbi:Acyl-protein thioesterase 2 [Ceratocystis platani]|uniref:Acyl-protein thioesterase 2 n=1 Tax=Ceratocystis fimbriata f. sp. platani TaxID=88771 RepID=A0A0F8BWA9_CERFI|nr:Acyl-protein thioesterase 2 [Ceratocystis platani]